MFKIKNTTGNVSRFLWKIFQSDKKLAKRYSDLAALEIYYINGADSLPPPLTPQREEELMELIKTDRAAARAELIEHNLRLVVYIAKKFENTGIYIEDLISIGTIGSVSYTQLDVYKRQGFKLWQLKK